jgi:hypothetical protein
MINNNKKYTYNSKKYKILNYQDLKYQNIDLTKNGILNKGFVLTPDIITVLISLNDIIQKMVNEKAGSNCTTKELKDLLENKICNKNMTLLKNSKCETGGFTPLLI